MLWFITYVDEPSGTFFILSPTYRAHIPRACAHPSAHHLRAYLSPIVYTSIEHEIANLSLTTLLPFSFIIIKKEENLRPLVHTSRAHWYTHPAPIGTHILRPLVHTSRAHRAHIPRAFITYC
jgi:hypothetical protein